MTEDDKEWVKQYVSSVQPPPSDLGAWIQGALRSWTVWAGAVLIAWPQIEPFARQILGEQNWARAVPFVGIVMILLRFKTNQSLKDKA